MKDKRNYLANKFYDKNFNELSSRAKSLINSQLDNVKVKEKNWGMITNINKNRKRNKDRYKVKNTPINLAHNKVRNATILGLDVNKYYQEYISIGGKRSLEELINRKPIGITDVEYKTNLEKEYQKLEKKRQKRNRVNIENIINNKK